ncbi:hypothetical protein AB5N19_02794 [Seiridium cardinale]|uniref:PARP catalytic domain-containing protein n=1 Tax=Seiridium cardinale TaxID=138064 RepID=A0ABR2XGJ0_9PEZI
MSGNSESILSEDELIELAFFRDLETDELIEHGFLSKDAALSSPLEEEYVLQNQEATLHIVTSPQYPAISVTYRVDNHTLSRESVIELRALLKSIVQVAEGVNDLEKWRELEENSFWEPRMVVLELAQETLRHLTVVRSKDSTNLNHDFPFQTKQASSNFTSGEQAFRYLSTSPKQIIANISSRFRVLHIEEVLRSNLARAFDRRQAQLQAVLSRQSLGALRHHVPYQLRHSKRKEDLVEHLIRPRMTFHGTQRQFVPSIVRNGLLKPGALNSSSEKAHEVRCGSSYGRGIYSSPSAEFSLMYSDYACHATKPSEFLGLKLIVCATLMGSAAQMFREDNWREQSEPYQGSDSHVANRELEYIVFDPAQIIPVYVVHLDWGQGNTAHFLDLPEDPTEWVRTSSKARAAPAAEQQWPEDIRLAKQAAYARAAKYFPYGYGPATGGRFVVEEVGQIDEDDEEYGEYQAFRGEEVKDKSNADFWSWIKAAEEDGGTYDGPDEYRNETRGYGPKSWNDLPAPVALEYGVEGELDEEDEGFGLERLLV